MLSAILSLFVIILTVLFLAVDLAIVIYISYLYYTSEIKSLYLQTLVSALLGLYILKFLSVFIFIPVIIYLINADYDIFDAINRTSPTSFLRLKDEEPLMFALIGVSYLVYFFCFVSILLINKELIKLASPIIAQQLRYIQLIDSTFFALYIIFGLLTIFLYLGEYSVEKGMKMKT